MPLFITPSRIKKVAFLLLIFLSGCSVLTRFANYGGDSKQFVEALMKEDYPACIQRIDLEVINRSGVPTDSLKHILQQMRESLTTRLGNELDIDITRINKTLSTASSEHVTQVLVQLSNKKEFTYAECKFNDANGRIVSFTLSDQKNLFLRLPYFGWLACWP
jgi:sugar/nucleoside kinase (ribokinase family)